MDNSLFESYELDLITLLNDLNLKLNKEIFLEFGGKFNLYFLLILRFNKLINYVS